MGIEKWRLTQILSKKTQESVAFLEVFSVSRFCPMAVTLALLLISTSAMAGTVDLTSEIKNADFSNGAANWTNEGSASNLANSSQIAVLTKNSQRGISQTLGINYEANKVYELSWKSGSANVGNHVQILSGSTVIESVLVSPRSGANTRVSYNFYVGTGSSYFVGQPITIRFAGNGVSAYNIDEIQLTMSDAKEYFDYGPGKKSMTKSTGGSASRYEYLVGNQGSFPDNAEKKYHSHANLSRRAVTMTYDSHTMYQELALDPAKKYKVLFSITTDHNATTRKEEIKADSVVLVPEFTLKRGVLDYFSLDIPESTYRNDGKVQIKVTNKIVNNVNGLISELILVEGEDLIPAVVADPAGKGYDKTSFEAKWHPVTGGYSYKLYVSTKPECDGDFIPNYDGAFVGSSLSFVVGNLDSTKDHYYKVVASDGVIDSADSNIIKVSKDIITPAYGVEVAKEGAKLKWSVDFEDAVVSYNVEKHINGVWTKVTTVAAKGEPNSNYSVLVGEGEFRLTAVDGSGFSQSFATASTKAVFINLNKGWNLISVPFEGADLSALEAEGALWSWNGTAYEKTEKANALQGLWVFSPVAKQVTLSGTQVADATVALSTGWNLVGPAQNCKMPAAVQVFSWEETYQQILETSAGLIQGHGYWMFTNNKRSVKLGE